MTIELTRADRSLLRELLEKELGSLKVEIHRTETTSFREELKTREQRLTAIIGQLESDESAA